VWPFLFIYPSTIPGFVFYVPNSFNQQVKDGSAAAMNNIIQDGGWFFNFDCVLVLVLVLSLIFMHKEFFCTSNLLVIHQLTLLLLWSNSLVDKACSSQFVEVHIMILG